MAVTPTSRYLFYLPAFPRENNKGIFQKRTGSSTAGFPEHDAPVKMFLAFCQASFGVFSTVMCVKPEGAVKIVLSAIALQ